MKRLNTYSFPEEILNSVTHGLGLVMGLAVGIFFIIKGDISDSWLTTFSLALYLEYEFLFHILTFLFVILF